MIREILNTEVKSIENDIVHIINLKNYRVKNFSGIPFEIANFSVLLIKNGSLLIGFSEETNIIKRKDLILIPVNSICNRLEASDNIRLYIIRTSFDFAINNSYEKELADAFSFLLLKSDHKIRLKEKDFSVLSLIYKLMHALQKDREKP